MINISQPATYIPLLAGTIIPFVVAYLTKRESSGTMRSVVAFAAAGLTALGAYLADVSHVQTLKGAVQVMIVALASAVVSRYAITGHKVDQVQAGPSGFLS